MAHHTVKHAHHTKHTKVGGQMPGPFAAVPGAASGQMMEPDPLEHGELPPSQGPQTFSHGGHVNQRKR